MGIFDQLFGAGQTGNQQAMTGLANGLIQQNQAANDQILTNSYGNAGNALNSGAANASSAINSSYGTGANNLTNYGSLAQALLGQGTNQAVGTALSGNSAFQPASSTGGSASSMLANLLGFNGTAGSAAATSAFQASPGYQYQLGQATQNAERAAAATGSLGSGNTLTAITQLGSNLANSEYQNYLGNLSNAATQGLAGATGLSANDKTASGYQSTAATTGSTLAQALGINLGTLDMNQGNQLSNLANTLGINTANNQTGYASALTGNNNTAIGAIAGNDLSLGKAEDSATNQNNQIFSSLLSKTAAPPFGGGSSVGGSLLKSLGSLF